MADIIDFWCLKYSYKLIEKSCSCMLLVGSRKAVMDRRRKLIASGMNPTNLVVVKTSQEQQDEFKKSGNSLVFMTLENWNQAK
ncbi:MAG: hypothetical protein JL50_02360 [Peptococcaceae bacterium BICA1-7]|nr:MAG: hypothetical protein JL50_02360 [Peptococcaceae bacterium BICA1-7]HBV95471.1 hypothetical protein [Desulfotomaculum sp.]